MATLVQAGDISRRIKVKGQRPSPFFFGSCCHFLKNPHSPDNTYIQQPLSG